ncbi:hypothetical protein J9303_04010 [Bacillaceae bacterium Marseille-Q3522]|nr:hypothetical protein [Bacillaceae bacterium Marseille-Q3522]
MLLKQGYFYNYNSDSLIFALFFIKMLNEKQLNPNEFWWEYTLWQFHDRMAVKKRTEIPSRTGISVPFSLGLVKEL